MEMHLMSHEAQSASCSGPAGPVTATKRKAEGLSRQYQIIDIIFHVPGSSHFKKNWELKKWYVQNSYFKFFYLFTIH